MKFIDLYYNIGVMIEKNIYLGNLDVRIKIEDSLFDVTGVTHAQLTDEDIEILDIRGSRDVDDVHMAHILIETD